MPKIQMTATTAQPSAPRPKETHTATIIEDAEGRRIKVRELNLVEEARLIRAWGDSASNVAFMSAYVLPAAMAEEIDGAGCAPPDSDLRLAAQLQRLGRAGLTAILEHIGNKGREKAQEEAALKKSEPTQDGENPVGS